MKKLIFSLLFLVPVLSFAQIAIQSAGTEKKGTLGVVKGLGYYIGEISYTIEGKDTTYTFYFRNNKYSQLVDVQYVSFDEQGGTLNQLYDVMKSVFKEENKKNKDYEVKFNLGDTPVIVSGTKLSGTYVLWFYTPNGYCYLRENTVDKLFDKR